MKAREQRMASKSVICAPLVIFGFNRPKSLARLLASLEACPEFSHAQVIVFIDGPRSQIEEAAVYDTRQVAQSHAKSNWEMRFSDVNKGLRQSIYEGVKDVCSRYGSAIVLEDDLVVSPVALTYFNNALEKYRHHDRVWSICGYGYQKSALEGHDRAFFLPFAHPWGWATWDRAWSKFDVNDEMPDSNVLISRSFKNSFDLGGLIGATDLIRLSNAGLIDSWFIRWYFRIFSEGGVSLFPSDSLISNKGMSGGGTHASIFNPYALIMGKLRPVARRVPDFPVAVTCDYDALDTLVVSRDSRAQRLIGKIGYYRRIVRSKWRAAIQK